MTPFHSDPWLTVYQGDCRATLATLPAESVHCVVTSPPYWGLRDYGTASWDGGDAECDHRIYGHAPGKPTPGGRGGSMPMQEVIQRESCSKCGATRIDSQLGLEPTPEQYVANMVAVFREVRRVLRDDGTLWLNLGDSYVSNGWWPDAPSSQNPSISRSQKRREGGGHGITRAPGLKPKDLVGIPWRVAFALQADGWYLRSDIIWSKPNPMPESVTDRPTKSHEYLFLLAKSQRYYFDGDAVREAQLTQVWPGIGPKHGTTDNHKSDYQPMEVNDGRNIRSVWTIATQPYPGAHFATFPPKLVEPCIKAGCPELGTVLDPFAGSGTTLMVAQQLSRRAIGIDLNAAYLLQCLERNQQTPLGLVGQTRAPYIRRLVHDGRGSGRGGQPRRERRGCARGRGSPGSRGRARGRRGLNARGTLPPVTERKR